MTFNFGGSGAIDNIRYTCAPDNGSGNASVPAPAGAGLALLAAGLLTLRRSAR